MSETRLDPLVVEFCKRLEKLEPGDRARLKRSAGRALADARQVMGLFFRLLPRGVPRSHEGAYFVVATLYPLAGGGGTGNLGDSLLQVRSARYAQGLDRRVEHLLDADREQLAFRLRQAVRFLESQRQGTRGAVNWPQLLHDLLHWDHPKRYVQERWARSYYAHDSED